MYLELEGVPVKKNTLYQKTHFDQEEDDVDFSGLSHLAKNVNFKQECLDECYKRLVTAIKSKD